MNLRDHLPRRISDPLFRVRSHVARRTGADDPTRERRKRRELERQPRRDPTLPRELVDFANNFKTVTVVTSPGHTVAAGGDAVVTVSCPGGMTVIGGGWLSDTSIINVFESYPASTTSWRVTIQNPDVSIATNTIYAICLGP